MSALGKLQSSAAAVVSLKTNVDTASSALANVFKPGMTHTTIKLGSPEATSLSAALKGVDAALATSDQLWKHTGPVMHGSRGAELLSNTREQLQLAQGRLAPVRAFEDDVPQVTLHVQNAVHNVFHAKQGSDDLVQLFAQDKGAELSRSIANLKYLAGELGITA